MNIENWQAVVAIIWFLTSAVAIPMWLWLTLGRTFKEGGALS